MRSFALCAALALGEVPVETIDAYVQSQMQVWHVPGISVGVAQDGQTLLAKGYGLANVELAVPATADTAYELLSVGKQFTAAAVMLLCHDGKVALDDAVSKHLPDLPAAWSAITVRQCLSHTSGIPDYTDVRDFFEHARDDATPAELLATVREKPLRFEPGTQWRYSNSNYYVLGQLVEKLAEQPFEQFTESRIFRPLGMSATRIDVLTDVIPRRADGYQWLGDDAEAMPAFISGYHGRKNVLQNAVSISPTRKWAAGAFRSTVNDLLAWDAALTNGKLLPAASIAEMVTNAKLADGTTVGYGLGNELAEVKGHHVAGHQGGGLAFNCALYRLVDDRLTVIVLCNQTSAPSRAIAAHIAALFVPGISDENASAIEDKEPQVTALVKAVLEDAAQGVADPDRFAASAKDTVQFVKRVGPRFLGPRGALRAVTLIERKDEAGKRLYRYRAEFESGPLVWTFELDSTGRILALEPDS